MMTTHTQKAKTGIKYVTVKLLVKKKALNSEANKKIAKKK